MTMNVQDSMHRDFSLPPVQRDLPPPTGDAADVVDPTTGTLVQDNPAPFPTSPQP